MSCFESDELVDVIVVARYTLTAAAKFAATLVPAPQGRAG
jgi:hypothetical protein